MTVNDTAVFLARLAILIAIYLLLWSIVRLAVRSSAEPERAHERPGSSQAWFGVEAPAATGLPRGAALAAGADTRIGRDPSNDLALADRTVSAFHARLARLRGRWVLEDLDSTNGTSVQGHRLAPRSELRGGELIYFGAVGLRFGLDRAQALRVVGESQQQGEQDEVHQQRGATVAHEG